MMTYLLLPFSARTGDFFDNCIMARLQQELEDLTQRTQLDVLGPPHSVTFHSAVSQGRDSWGGIGSGVMDRWGVGGQAERC